MSAVISSPLISIMEELLLQSPPYTVPQLGSLVEAEVIDVVGNKILVDIAGIATGIISGKEARDSGDTLATLKPGDTISAYVIEEENEEGFYVLSLRKASQEKTWRNFLKFYSTGEVIQATISEANKGGLLVVVDGIKGFIPVSQLAPLHYPRVDGANSSEILSRLQKLIGETLKVKIINVDQVGGKLILSEKAAVEEERQQTFSKLKVGDRIKGVISGIVKFGIFVAFDGLEGLVHISEIEWGHVKDPSSYGKIGDPIEVSVIGIEGDKISLSMKRLTPDPWTKVAEKYKVGNRVQGTVDRITQFGVFLKLEDDISGLVHLSELSHASVRDPQKLVKVGEKLEAQVIAVDAEEHRIGLSLKALQQEEKVEAEAPQKKVVKKKIAKKK